ncbi:hypothetical protein [Amycolatopsis sp. H20-H5]|uniref:hypothetical protein n=1 Tax=Amycolatopsis sp. H20-H5 TaxID=3046309 RepID=UPI002DBDA3A3|nr:hypothetical protein [Amycolatopsis sp. H20-H5]MEC3977934.1 hypothetical protein [Amycolatopsis sp. H20-H5]
MPTSEPGRKVERKALWLVGITSAVLGTGTAAIWHAVAGHFRRLCVIEDAKNPESMCGFGVIFWGPALIVGGMLAIGLLTWFLLSVTGLRPRAGVLTSAFVSPALLVVLFATMRGSGAGRIFAVGAAFTLLQLMFAALTRIRRV